MVGPVAAAAGGDGGGEGVDDVGDAGQAVAALVGALLLPPLGGDDAAGAEGGGVGGEPLQHAMTGGVPGLRGAGHLHVRPRAPRGRRDRLGPRVEGAEEDGGRADDAARAVARGQEERAVLPAQVGERGARRRAQLGRAHRRADRLELDQVGGPLVPGGGDPHPDHGVGPRQLGLGAEPVEGPPAAVVVGIAQRHELLRAACTSRRP